MSQTLCCGLSVPWGLILQLREVGIIFVPISKTGKWVHRKNKNFAETEVHLIPKIHRDKCLLDKQEKSHYEHSDFIGSALYMAPTWTAVWLSERGVREPH